jgi:hypothetical protein
MKNIDEKSICKILYRGVATLPKYHVQYAVWRTHASGLITYTKETDSCYVAAPIANICPLSNRLDVVWSHMYIYKCHVTDGSRLILRTEETELRFSFDISWHKIIYLGKLLPPTFSNQSICSQKCCS